MNKMKYEINKSTREKDYLIICSVGYFRINNQIHTSFNMELCFNRYMISTLQNLWWLFGDREYDIDFQKFDKNDKKYEHIIYLHCISWTISHQRTLQLSKGHSENMIHRFIDISDFLVIQFVTGFHHTIRKKIAHEILEWKKHIFLDSFLLKRYLELKIISTSHHKSFLITMVHLLHARWFDYFRCFTKNDWRFW